MTRSSSVILTGIALLSSILFGCSGSELGTTRSEPNESMRGGKADFYGEDNRQEYYQVQNSILRHVAKSTAITVASYSLSQTKSDDVLKIEPTQSRNPLCENQRYSEQPQLGHCSAFLVDEDIIVTAGHCVPNSGACQAQQFAFGVYYSDKSDTEPARIPRDNVYKCEKLIESKVNFNKYQADDYAIIRLNRPVRGRSPLSVRQSGTPTVSAPLGVVGSPLGLPLKLAGNARVIDPFPDKDYFKANLDIFGGNSGGPVVNMRTGIVEGIAVRGSRGSKDGLTKVEGKKCSKWAQCESVDASKESRNRRCEGNEVMQTSAFIDKIREERSKGDSSDTTDNTDSSRPNRADTKTGTDGGDTSNG